MVSKKLQINSVEVKGDLSFQIISKAIWIAFVLVFSLSSNAEAAAIKTPNAEAGISDILSVHTEEFKHGIAKRSPALSPAIGIAVPPFAPATFKYCQVFAKAYFKKISPIWPKLGGPVGVAFGKYMSKVFKKIYM